MLHLLLVLLLVVLVVIRQPAAGIRVGGYVRRCVIRRKVAERRLVDASAVWAAVED